MTLHRQLYNALLFSIAAISSTASFAGPKPQVGTVLPSVTLEGDDGARVAGGKWSSDELKGKVWCVFYVDPDEKDTNDPTSQALKAAKFPEDKFGTYAIINMGATWVPNALIQKNLESKQKEFPKTIYVRDFKKVLVNKWGVGDDASVILLFAKDGKLLFHKDGKLSDAETQQLLQLIRTNM